ncbi:g-protein beta wd-40 repeats containing [Purpureocillium lavendulum]|uniref:G-protein beta wd-40 repeats containing n=1 Tax=Purpureocillium lavendulum TaxID=1247861 RepID=A0AB34FE65_9HYPO|nr:g-protein beta wd-40 repeats containing [Purpureocillium lavendulum]
MKVKRRRAMYYRLRLGKRLLELVRRFGYGTLVYPGFGCGDINDVNNNQIAALITHMEDCHPKLKEELNNLSHVVAVIVQWGAPPEQLAIEMIPYKSLDQHQDRSFNDLFAFPARPEYAFSWIEPGFAANVPSWRRNSSESPLGVDFGVEIRQLPPPPYSAPPLMGYDGNDVRGAGVIE